MSTIFNGAEVTPSIEKLQDTDFSKVTVHPEFVVKGKKFYDETGQLKAGTAALVGTAKDEQEKSVNITENGTTEVTPDEGYALSKVIVNTNVESGGGGSLEGFHAVRFFNDDRTTLLYTVYVASGTSAIYAGDAPVSTEDSGAVFQGFEPAATNVTSDMDCYAVYELEPGTLEETSWALISKVSADGTAENYFAVGDTKMIHVEGTVGTSDVNGDYGVYIIGFNHNSAIEGNGITFGTFKDAVSNGNDLCLISSKNSGSSTDGSLYFNMNHWGGRNAGGWSGCDMRYDILGSTDQAPSGYGARPQTGRTGYEPSATCTSNPVANTLMSALPAELREVMKPMTIYSDNVGAASNTASCVTLTIDYLPLLSEFEIFGTRKMANSAERNYQKRYAYYAAGNSVLKYAHSGNSPVTWWQRSPVGANDNSFVLVNSEGASSFAGAESPRGVAPIFRV